MSTPSLLDYTRLGVATIAQPVVVLWRLALSPFTSYEKRKPWRRVVSDASFRWTMYTQNVAFLAYMMGTSVETYESYMKKNSLMPCIQEIGDNARLLWLGEKHPEHVILYLHGGGFLFPLADYGLAFWGYVQKEVTRKGCKGVAVAVLDYSVLPDAPFPVPIRQTVAAVNRIVSEGIKPENIVLAGDSAGGNLILQLLLHMIHPIEGVPVLPVDMKFKGAYMMSPWTDLLPRSEAPSYQANPKWDIVAPQTLAFFGNACLDRVQDEKYLKYLDAHYTPDGWYDGIDQTVEEVLITAGGAECLRDDIVRFAELFTKAHGNTRLIVDNFGAHDDPFLDFVAGETHKLSELTPVIVEWIQEMFETR